MEIKTPKPEEKKPAPKRQLLIETDGKDVFIAKNEMNSLEIYAILKIVLNNLNIK